MKKGGKRNSKLVYKTKSHGGGGGCPCPPYTHIYDGIQLSTVEEDTDKEILDGIAQSYATSLKYGNMSDSIRPAVKLWGAKGVGIVALSCLNPGDKVDTRQTRWSMHKSTDAIVKTFGIPWDEVNKKRQVVMYMIVTHGTAPSENECDLSMCTFMEVIDIL